MHRQHRLALGNPGRGEVSGAGGLRGGQVRDCGADRGPGRGRQASQHPGSGPLPGRRGYHAPGQGRARAEGADDTRTDRPIGPLPGQRLGSGPQRPEYSDLQQRLSYSPRIRIPDRPDPGFAHQPPRRRDRPRGLRGLLRALGPGLITGASDDDPSGIGTYSQVGSQFGLGLLWTALFTFPLMAAVQELCARIALETGEGLGASLRRKFPRWLVGLAVLGLLIANTINVGADLGAVAAGGALLSRGALKTIWLVVPVAALILGMQIFASYDTIFKIFKWLTLALFAYVVSAIYAHPDLREVLWATFVPHVEFSREFITAMVAVFGTTISPYLFFWQASSEVDELAQAGRVTENRRRGCRTSDLRAARTDVVIGMFFSNLVMYFIILTTAAVLHAHGKTDIQTADQAAAALAPLAGPFAFIVFALGMVGAGLLAIPILSGSAT
ncbi:MAG: divalent metal cation transporter, partial [Chloroflexi bacterium]